MNKDKKIHKTKNILRLKLPFRIVPKMVYLGTKEVNLLNLEERNAM